MPDSLAAFNFDVSVPMEFPMSVAAQPMAGAMLHLRACHIWS